MASSNSSEQRSMGALSRQSSADKYEVGVEPALGSDPYGADFAGSEDSGDSSHCLSPSWGLVAQCGQPDPEAPMDITLRVRRGTGSIFQDINFTFDPESDTFLDVATELVATLGYENSDVVRFATKIESCVHRTRSRRAAFSQGSGHSCRTVRKSATEPGGKLSVDMPGDLVAKQHRALAEKHQQRVSGLMAKNRPCRISDTSTESERSPKSPLSSRRASSINETGTDSKISFCTIRGMNMPDVVKLKRCPSSGRESRDMTQNSHQVKIPTATR